ncbi:FAD-dependent oxidoreductase [Mycolicibacterium sp. CH28]|uniref:NAD(P)-binding protein n=1 Tax=Mycolicibacterium sp. CH28 TaxID=2512237 RepID=UPI00107FD98D|nr:NAD(P)-binding protein [Mycolicibacterium sp. CH28]TGD87042.1 FAD-dependent oxidoreductase [Mycolicibacterium sp. CH28]
MGGIITATPRASASERGALDVDVLVIGAGPTGLSAADACVTAGASVAVVERTGQVGGLARAATVAGNEVDLGGHRLLSATPDQRRAWTDFADRLGGIAMGELGRRSGILRDGYVVGYPFDWKQFRDSVPWRVRARGAVSLLARKAMARTSPADGTLDQWVKNRYGPYLAEKFMAPHARKVFGIDPKDIPASWAAQRILAPRAGAVLATALPRRPGYAPPRAAADRFLYPLGGVGVLWSALAESLGNRVNWLFDSGVESIAEPRGGRIAVTVSGPGGPVAVSCTRIISTGRPEDLAAGMGLDELASSLSQTSRRRDLVVGVVRVRDYPESWRGYQWLYTHDTGIRAHRFNNFGEWQHLRCPVGVIGLEYTVPAGESVDVRATAMSDMSILLGAQSSDFLGWEVARDAYSNFDASAAAFEILDAALHGFGAGIISTGRQGAGVYINLDQAMRLGRRVAGMPDGRTGVVGRDEYSAYQEKVG